MSFLYEKTHFLYQNGPQKTLKAYLMNSHTMRACLSPPLKTNKKKYETVARDQILCSVIFLLQNGSCHLLFYYVDEKLDTTWYGFGLAPCETFSKWL